MNNADVITVTPWQATGKFNDAVYDKLVTQFGVQRITSSMIERFENLTGHKAHRLLRRQLFFAHRDLNEILDDFEKGKPIFIYTGRGPSGALHMGHYIILEFTVWLQKVLKAIIVFQIADDEKFWFKDNTFSEIYELGKQNTVDIIALGFDPEKTFIFSNHDFKGQPAYKRICDDIMKIVKIKDIEATFGITNDCNIGQLLWPIYQMAASFSPAFEHLFHKQNIKCLIPCAIDQDLYFRVARDVAPKLGLFKPSTILCRFLPALTGDSKMSTTGTTGPCKTIFLTDTHKEISNKINKYAFSGGQDTAEKHRELGGNTEIDVPFQWLIYFMEDDAELLHIKEEYEAGRMLTGELKKICINMVTNVALDHQAKKKLVL